jgi:hypothetical protein
MAGSVRLGWSFCARHPIHAARNGTGGGISNRPHTSSVGGSIHRLIRGRTDYLRPTRGPRERAIGLLGSEAGASQESSRQGTGKHGKPSANQDSEGGSKARCPGKLTAERTQCA